MYVVLQLTSLVSLAPAVLPDSSKRVFLSQPCVNMPGLSAEDNLGTLLVFPQGRLELEQSSRAPGLGMAAGSILRERVEGRRQLLPRPSRARKMETLYRAFGWDVLGHSPFTQTMGPR